jgi:hypothetical protein
MVAGQGEIVREVAAFMLPGDNVLDMESKEGLGVLKQPAYSQRLPARFRINWRVAAFIWRSPGD